MFRDHLSTTVAKGFIALRWVFVELFKKNKVSNLSKYTAGEKKILQVVPGLLEYVDHHEFFVDQLQAGFE